MKCCNDPAGYRLKKLLISHVTKFRTTLLSKAAYMGSMEEEIRLNDSKLGTKQ